jgi:hypothetical protein
MCFAHENLGARRRSLRATVGKAEAIGGSNARPQWSDRGVDVLVHIVRDARVISRSINDRAARPGFRRASYV